MPDASSERSTMEEMRAQVDAAHAAAERLVREADAQARDRAREAETAAREGFQGTPPSGWEAPGGDGPRRGERSASEDLRAIAALLEVARDAMRTSIPPELAQQFADAVRQLLVALRALIDWYIDRLDRGPVAPVEVEDIPID